MPTTLILAPTPFELTILRGALESKIDLSSVALECCGFGVIAAAARAAQFLSLDSPERIVLTGIAGTFNNRLQIGHAYWFSEVAAFGIGAGSGPQFLTAGEMDWPHWDAPAGSAEDRIGDVIQLTTGSSPREPNAGMLLTVCAASAQQSDVDLRLAKFPAAAAEDMEGFSAALAGRICDVPVEIVRGISNNAGDRNKENWQIREALAAAAELIIETLA
ncbi:MAG: futalosine hydrolase [Fuerstiella sp.]